MICLFLALLFVSSRCYCSQMENQADLTVEQSRLVRFISVASGYYTGHIYRNGLIPVAKTVLPVEATAFYPDVAYFLEELEGDSVPMRQVYVLSESVDGFIHATPYNFTGSDTIRDDKGEIDVKLFHRLQRSDYSTMPHCVLVIKKIDNVYISNWPECESTTNNLTPTYFTVWGCNSAGFIFYENPQLDTESINPVIVAKHTRFPLLPYMLKDAKNFTESCV